MTTVYVLRKHSYENAKETGVSEEFLLSEEERQDMIQKHIAFYKEQGYTASYSDEFDAYLFTKDNKSIFLSKHNDQIIENHYENGIPQGE